MRSFGLNVVQNKVPVLEESGESSGVAQMK